MAQNSAKGSSYITPSLDGLTDVTIAGATTNQVLTYNGTTWVNSATQGDMLKSVYDTDNDGVVDSAEKEVLDVRNTSGSTIAKGAVVYIGGATGQLPTILLADADTEATSSKTIGLTLTSIANNSNGVIITSGLFHDVDTSAFSDGDSLWLSSTAGGMVANTPPAEPAHSVYIGRVAYAHPTQGKIVVAIQNGYELDELHGVSVTSEANQDVLRYETSSGLWKNQQIETASSSQKGLLSSTDWTTFNNKQNAITLTTIGNSGNATLVGSTLNIPNYSSSLIPDLRGHETFRGVTFNNNSTTDTTWGGVTLGTTASTIARSVASTSFATKQIRKGFYGSVVSTGRYTGIRGSALLFYIGGGWKYVCEFYISDTAYGSGCRQFYGMMGQTTDLTYNDTTTVASMLNIIGVGSDAADSNLQIFHNDGSGTATKVDLGGLFPANRTAGAAMTTTYTLELYNANSSANVVYKVTNNESGDYTEGTLSTNLPLDTQGLNFCASRCMGAAVTNTGQFDLSILGVYSI